MENRLKVLVGLGNPGAQFHWTRHNAGYDVMHQLARSHAVEFSVDEGLNAEVARVSDTLILVKPTTGMNDSGVTVAAAVTRYGISTNDLLIVYDDSSLPLGKFRFAKSGSAGGHNGIKSIIAALGGSLDFPRLRVAVGPDPGGAERYTFVLSPIATELRDLYGKAIATAAEAGQHWLANSIEASMGRYNGLDLTRV